MTSNWTRDADGNYVDWTKPPYYVNGVLLLVLPGEDIVDHDELARRRGEYMKLQYRRIGHPKRKAPSKTRGRSSRQKSV